MRLFLLTAATMCAFAGNSILNRGAVDGAGMDPLHFAAIRTLAGAATLALLLRLRQGARAAEPGWRGAIALSVYMIGFSWAYLTLPAGLGALILFAVVQVTMFGWAAARGQRPPPLRWAGAGIALAGLAVLLWPAEGAQVAPAGALAMAVAGAGWAAYSILGQKAPDALAATAANFVRSVPLVLPFVLLTPLDLPGGIGVALAICAGALTSGLGYALWYAVLPHLQTSVAAVAQLSVPVLAVLAGAALLGETLDARTAGAGALVLGGIGLSVLGQAQRISGSKGS